MKRLFYCVIILFAIDANAQSRKTITEQTDMRPTVLNEINRTEQFTYSYIEVNGEKIFDGPFTFVANGNKSKAYEKVTGQFKNGAMDGLWTWTVKCTDIHLLTHEQGRYLTLDATMTRQYSNGNADGEWECSYIAKRRDMKFDTKKKAYIPQEYIKSLEEHYNQKATFHANRLTIERDGEKVIVIDGVYYCESDAQNVIVNHQQKGISWEDYLYYARGFDPIEIAEILSDLYNRDAHYIDFGNERMRIEERGIEPKIFETELLNRASLFFTPLWNLGSGFQTSVLTPTFVIRNIDTIQEYNETEITEYLKSHSSEEFRIEYIENRAFKSEDLAKLMVEYDKKCKEEEEIRRLELELDLFKDDKRLYIGVPVFLDNGSFVLGHPEFVNLYEFYNNSNGSVVDFLEPKFPEGWTSKWEGWYNGHGELVMRINIPNTEKYCTEIKNAFFNATTFEEANSILKEWDDAVKRYEELKRRLKNYENTVNYRILFPVADLFEKKALSAFMKQHSIDKPDEAASLYLKEGATNESYSTMYWTFMKVKNDITPSDFQTEAEYFEHYYSAVAKLAEYCINNNKAKRLKTPEELLQAAGVSLK